MKFTFTAALFCFFQCLLAQNNTRNTTLDSVYMTSGSVLVGKISIDKDNDRFILEARDTFTFQLLPHEVKRFTYNVPERNGEKTTYISIFQDFYFLEFGQNAPITAYARYTYTPVLDDGPKYFIVKKKYCFFKGRVPFFPRLESFKNDLLILIDDCPKVARKVQYRDIKIDEIVNYVIDYNNCNGKVKK